jgi:hypothetical protein
LSRRPQIMCIRLNLSTWGKQTVSISKLRFCSGLQRFALSLEVSSKLSSVHKFHTGFFPNKQEAPQP